MVTILHKKTLTQANKNIYLQIKSLFWYIFLILKYNKKTIFLRKCRVMKIKLSEKEQLLVNGADKGLYKSLNINYSISADNAKDVLLGKTAGNYTQTVIYTVTH